MPFTPNDLQFVGLRCAINFIAGGANGVVLKLKLLKIDTIHMLVVHA